MVANAALATSIVANGVDLTRSDGRLLFYVTRGIDDVPEVRGQDVIVPGLGGRIPMNRRLDRLIVEAHGMVMGAGADETAQRVDFRSLIESLRDLMNPSSDPYNVVITVEDGSTRTITARPLNIVWSDIMIPTYREGSLQWESVDFADWGIPDGS